VELLDWLNSTLQLRLTKIEETASGAVACQIFDLLFPGTVQMSRVNWGAKSEWEFVANYKVLQAACDKVGVDKKIDVDRLIKARQQDNLEFLQWLKKFFDDNVSGVGEYDAPGRRAIGKGASTMKWCKGASGAPGASAISPSKPSTVRPVRTTPPGQSSRAAATTAASTAAAAVKKPAVEKETSSLSMEHTTVVSALKDEIDSYRKILEAHRTESNDRIARLEMQLKQCESERDYYFSKLKNVELAIEALPENQDGKLVMNTISHILYDDPSQEEPSRSTDKSTLEADDQ
jgi:RP/EB family microtubule-associated protein